MNESTKRIKALARRRAPRRGENHGAAEPRPVSGAKNTVNTYGSAHISLEMRCLSPSKTWTTRVVTIYCAVLVKAGLKSTLTDNIGRYGKQYKHDQSMGPSTTSVPLVIGALFLCRLSRRCRSSGIAQLQWLRDWFAVAVSTSLGVYRQSIC